MTHSRVKGLVTVALLKSQYDARKDHVGMFQPLLLDTVCAREGEDFTVEEVKQEFQARHGLVLPIPALQTLLNRAKRDGHIARQAGRWIRSSNIPHPHVTELRGTIEAEHAILAMKLREYGASKKREIETSDEALALLLAFLEENQIAFLLDGPGPFELVPPPSLTPRDALVVARFITDVCLAEPQLAGFLRRMLEGFVLQNALLLRDIGSVSGKFSDLTVFLDTRFLFGVLGLCGTVIQQSAKETLDLFKATQVRLAVFEPTLDEMKRVLSVYERKLGTSAGIQSLLPGLLTKHFLKRKYTPSDVKQAIALLERNMKELGIHIPRAPSPWMKPI